LPRANPFREEHSTASEAGHLELIACAKNSETDPGRQKRAEGLTHCESSPPRPLPYISLSPTRCRERFGVSSAAPPIVAPFECKRCLAYRTGLGFLSRVSREGERVPKSRDAFHRVVVLLGTKGSLPSPARTRSPCHAALRWSRLLANFAVSLLRSGIAIQGVPAPLCPRSHA